MELAVEIESSELRSEGIGEKRPLAEDGDSLRSHPKRIRGTSELNLAFGDVKKVAEMVLVLAVMCKMRSGREPVMAEKELMEEARNRLAKFCEGFAPKDVFPGDAFRGVIEDLGLSKLKEQKIGVHPPKISIVEKLLVSKRKMEKAEDFSKLSNPQSSHHLPRTSGATVESFTSHPQMSHFAKSNHMSVSCGDIQFQFDSPLGHVTTSHPTPFPYQLPTSEIRPLVSGVFPQAIWVQQLCQELRDQILDQMEDRMVLCNLHKFKQIILLTRLQGLRLGQSNLNQFCQAELDLIVRSLSICHLKLRELLMLN